MSLDTRKRAETLATLGGQEWDLLVIGGGITGAGIALDAATRGMRVALVEMQDFAAGTSSRSTKLIHGGLRYLKQFEIGLVREVGRERAILHRNAGHIVHPRKMLLPSYAGGTFGRFGLWFGLWVYDWLAGVKRGERRSMLSAADVRARVRGINPQGLKGAGLYTEYSTDDGRLTMEVIKTAVAHGATAINYAQVTGLRYANGKVTGATVRDLLGGTEVQVHAKVVANAAGPWVDGIRQMDNSLKGKRLHHTKGVHLVVPHARLPIDLAMYFDVGDGRMIFAIPRDQWTYFGTTDTNYKGSLEHPQVTAADVDYLLGAVNRMFPALNLQRADIESSWAGIRPLIHEDGKDPSQLSRKDELMHAESGLLTIAGGKLTGFRKMAEKVVDEAAAQLRAAGRADVGRCVTDTIPLSGHLADAGPLVSELAATGIGEREARWLVGIYGAHAQAALALGGGTDKLAVLRGALRYSIREEAAAQLGDFFVRRTAMVLFGRKWIPECLATATEVLHEELGADWDCDRGQVWAGEYADAVDFRD